MKALVGVFNQEKALVGADGSFAALLNQSPTHIEPPEVLLQLLLPPLLLRGLHPVVIIVES